MLFVVLGLSACENKESSSLGPSEPLPESLVLCEGDYRIDAVSSDMSVFTNCSAIEGSFSIQDTLL